MDANTFRRPKPPPSPSHLLVTFYKAPLNPAKVKAFQAAITGRETGDRANGRHHYMTFPDGIGGVEGGVVIMDKILGARGTSRNWNTITKLAALAA